MTLSGSQQSQESEGSETAVEVQEVSFIYPPRSSMFRRGAKVSGRKGGRDSRSQSQSSNGHSTDNRQALDRLSFRIRPAEVFAFLGPNGGGKTTLFRLLSTLIPLQSGAISVFGFDVQSQTQQVRELLGVVFQAASLDKKLTVIENIRIQATLYGLSGQVLRDRENELLQRLGLQDRIDDYIETLSGGLKRRVELAKGMIHRPRLLILDEPSTGLDPGARSDLWRFLHQLRDDLGVTIVFTTHLLEEAERADRIAILDHGKLVALDSPDALRATVGGDAITIVCSDSQQLADSIRERFGVDAQVVDGNVRLEIADGASWIPKLMDGFGDEIHTITLGRPTLEDVFISKTGHKFWQATDE